jgi:hypothetical protein
MIAVNHGTGVAHQSEDQFSTEPPHKTKMKALPPCLKGQLVAMAGQGLATVNTLTMRTTATCIIARHKAAC